MSCRLSSVKKIEKKRKKYLTSIEKGVNISPVAFPKEGSTKKLEKSLKKVLTKGKQRCIIKKLAKRAGNQYLEN